jgi:hypothetical protein
MTTRDQRQRQKQKAWVIGFLSGLNAEELPPIISTDLQDAANKGFQAGAAARDLESDDAEAFITEINRYHDEKGRFSSKKNAETASITKKAAEREGVKAERGKISPSTGKVYASFGMNTGSDEKQAGRTNFNTSEPKKKTRSVKDYPKDYDELSEVMSTADDAYIRGIIKQELEAFRRELRNQARSQSEDNSDGSADGSRSRARRSSIAGKKRHFSAKEGK